MTFTGVKVLDEIILDYKEQLETADKFNKILDIIENNYEREEDYYDGQIDFIRIMVLGRTLYYDYCEDCCKLQYDELFCGGYGGNYSDNGGYMNKYYCICD